MNTLVRRAPLRGLVGASRGPKHLNGRRKGYWQAVARSRRQLEIIGVIKTAPNNERALTNRGKASIASSDGGTFFEGSARMGRSSKTFRKAMNPIRAKRQRQNAADR